VVVVVLVVAAVVVDVVGATRCRRRGGAGIGDGTSAGSPATAATLSRSSAASIVEIGLLPRDGSVVSVARIVVAQPTAGESRAGCLLLKEGSSRRDVALS